jgi:hypothetical protein
MPTGNVQITIVDGGSAAVVVPGATVQLVIGTSSSGTAAQIVATQNPNTLVANFGYGPLVEAAALTCLAGGTVLAMKATTVTNGSSSAVQFTGTGSSVITVTGNPFDDYFVQFLVVSGGAIGTGPITFQLSLDAGRNFGPVLNLGTATTYAIPNTGLTLNFGVGNLVTGDTAKFQCTAPASNAAGIQACLSAFQASQYAIAGVGSAHVPGVTNGALASTLEGYLDTLAAGYVFNRLMVSARDALAPTAWTGVSAESESTWMNSLANDYSATSARRICASGGFYNMPSAFPNPVCGSPRYRRSLAWALAAREVTIPPQRHAGRVKDGSLTQIVVDPTNDPKDGFIYHDERINPGLDAARFNSAWTRVGLPGFYIKNPNLMSPLGSQFTLLPLGNVMDIACDIVHQVGQQEIDADVRLNPNGTIYVNDALALQAVIGAALDAQMLGPNMISGYTVTVDQTNNVQATSIVNVTVTIQPRGYVLELDATIGFLLPNQAQPA